jgi:hypothetical protein
MAAAISRKARPLMVGIGRQLTQGDVPRLDAANLIQEAAQHLFKALRASVFAAAMLGTNVAQVPNALTKNFMSRSALRPEFKPHACGYRYSWGLRRIA